ncbi:NAC domain family protein [Candida albicans]|uniref:Nascent polypeptide-associated complex subunit beta n=1 Tax=Candida albicans TaxID=5476 RepID=A0A8H6BXS5_CANAX|nr:NAC domain family protein [Candida albicans]
MPVDPEKLAKLQKSSAKKVGGVEEANFFREDGKVLHFNRVGVQGAPASNTFAFTGYPQEKNITQLIPQILPQLGAENLEILRQLAEQIQSVKLQKTSTSVSLTSSSMPVVKIFQTWLTKNLTM